MDIKKYRIQYQIVLLMMVLVLIVSSFIIIYNLKKIENDAEVINQLGVQKTLSQQISKDALVMEETHIPKQFIKAKRDLTKYINQWEETHFKLTHGDDYQDATPFSKENKKLFNELAPHLLKIVDAGKKLSQTTYSTDSSAKANIAAQVKIILDHDDLYLATKDEISKKYTFDSKKGFSTLRWSVYISSVIIILLLLSIIFFFMKPLIKGALDKMEKMQKSHDDMACSNSNLKKQLESQKKINAQLFNAQEDMEKANHELLESKTKIQSINTSLFIAQEDMEKANHELLESKTKIQSINTSLFIAQEDMERKAHLLMESESTLKKTTKELELSKTELQEKSNKMSALINNTQNLIFSIDKNYKLTAANDATIDFFKQHDIDIKLGVSDIKEIYYDNNATIKLEEFIERALLGERFSETELTKDKTWITSSYNPILDENDEVKGVSIFVEDITDKKNKQLEKEKISRLNKLHNEAITALTKFKFVEVSDSNEAYKIINKEASKGLEVDRCSIWIINSTLNILECKDLYISASKSHESREPITEEKYPNYYNFAISGKYLSVKDVKLDETTIKLAHDYFQPNNIISILNTPIRVNGEIIGFLSSEYKGVPRHWELEEVNFLQTVSSFVTLSLEALQRKEVQFQLEQSNEEQIAINEAMLITKNELATKNEELNLTQVELKRIVSEQLAMNEKLLSAEKEIKCSLEQEQKSKEQLKDAQSQLVHNEKMASLGQLTAGIAHEINNPINFVYNGIDTLKISLNELLDIINKYSELDSSRSFAITSKIILDVKELKQEYLYNELIEDINLLVSDIRTGAVRTMEIVKGLRVFSRLDEEAMKKASISECLDSTLILLNNKIKNKVIVNKYYDNDTPIFCYPGQLNQVFMNIISNSVQAIKEKNAEDGQIDIYTENLQENIVIRIKDNGNGMSASVQKRIFEPFFTTKEVGIGTGLGLSISYGIIDKHDGQIYVNSEEGKGTEFVIRLPKNLIKKNMGTKL